MATATAPDEPIVAVYPVPGELDEGEKGHAALAPIPVRLARADAERAVKRGAFSFVDPTLKDREAAAKAGAPEAAKVSPASKSDIAAAVKAAMAEASKETDARIAELERQLAEATTPADGGK